MSSVNLTLPQIQVEVYNWSHQNFGEQDSKSSSLDGVPVRMGSLMPLMGIGEEIMELEFASELKDRIDAVGDIGIYLCDYTAREKFDLESYEFLKGNPESGTSFRSLPTCLPGIRNAYGKLLHITIKKHQGIRGYDDVHKYQTERDEAVIMLLRHLAGYSEWILRVPFMTVLNDIWEGVCQRDWKKNPAQGVQS